MAHLLWKCPDWCHVGLLGASFVSNSYGAAPGDQEMGQLLITSLLGAFCGLIGGFVLSQIMRYFAMISGRNLGSHVWTLAGTLVGACLFLILGLRDLND